MRRAEVMKKDLVPLLLIGYSLKVTRTRKSKNIYQANYWFSLRKSGKASLSKPSSSAASRPLPGSSSK